MLVTVSNSVEQVTINDGLGPVVTITKKDGPIELPMDRALKLLEKRQIQKAQYAGIDNNDIVAIEMTLDGWKARKALK